jgi:hypothetical protein
VTRCRKSVDRANALRCQLAKQLAEARALAADQRNIARANLAKIEHVWLCRR